MTNYYNDTTLTDATEVTMETFDYIPAVVTKSNSLTSNECLTSRSSFDDMPTQPSRPPTSLKIIFKRHSENNYEIKPSTFQDEPSQISNDSWLTDPKPIDDPNDLANGKRRPTRKSARKVKFIFSDYEDNDQQTPVKRKRPNNKTIKKASNEHLIQTPQMLPQVLPQIYQDIPSTQARYHNLESDDSDNDMYQELLLKNMPPNIDYSQIFQTQYFLNALSQNIAPPPAMNINQQRPARNNKTSKKSKPTARAKTKRQRQPPRKAVTRSRANSQEIESTHLANQESSLTQNHFKQQDERESTILPGELVKSTLMEKHNILNNQPSVQMEHSEPFPIALVENETNIVETKALLFLHLFQSLSCPCIGCPACHSYMTCAEFSKHVHKDEDEPDVLIESEKSYKILPYRMDDEELSDEALNTWKIFGKRYAEFKQRQTQVVLEPPEQAQTSTPTNCSNEKQSVLTNRDLNNNYIESNEVGVTKKVSRQLSDPVEFSEWDYKENDTYHISESRLLSDQVCVVECERDHQKIRDTEIHYFMEKKEDLLLSEDECSQDEIDEGIELSVASKEISIIDTNEDDIEERMDLPVDSNEASIINSDESDIQDLVTELIDQIEIDLEPSSLTNELESVKHSLRTHRLSYDEESLDTTMSSKPTIMERYFNLYDNLTNDMLLYICENEFTVIPDSFVMYVNSKREINSNELKLANTDYYQSKWLEQSLDLECSRRFD